MYSWDNGSSDLWCCRTWCHQEIVDAVHADVWSVSGCPHWVQVRHNDRDSARALLADRMAKSAEFFSFGTNDLTRWPSASAWRHRFFMNDYLDQKILPRSFQTIDQDGVGQLITMLSRKAGLQDQTSRSGSAGSKAAIRLRRILLQE